MYALIATGGKQYTVKEGDEIVIEKLGVEAGQTVTFDEVLFVGGENAKIGNPTVAGATVSATEARKLLFASIRLKRVIQERMVTDSHSQELRLRRLTHNHSE